MPSLEEEREYEKMRLQGAANAWEEVFPLGVSQEARAEVTLICSINDNLSERRTNASSDGDSCARCVRESNSMPQDFSRTMAVRCGKPSVRFRPEWPPLFWHTSCSLADPQHRDADNRAARVG